MGLKVLLSLFLFPGSPSRLLFGAHSCASLSQFVHQEAPRKGSLYLCLHFSHIFHGFL